MSKNKADSKSNNKQYFIFAIETTMHHKSGNNTKRAMWN